MFPLRPTHTVLLATTLTSFPWTQLKHPGYGVALAALPAQREHELNAFVEGTRRARLREALDIYLLLVISEYLFMICLAFDVNGLVILCTGLIL